MVKKIKKHWDLALIAIVGFALTLTALFTVFPNPAYGDVATTVVVTATVQEYLTFTASATSTTLSPDLVDNTGATHVGSSSNITLTLNTSSADGYSINVKGVGNGLATGTDYIFTSSATATLAAGTDGFGLQATSTVSGLTVNANFMWPFTATVVGSASSSVAKQLATKSSSGSSQTVTVRFLAACDSAQPAGTYQDTVTFTAVPTP